MAFYALPGVGWRGEASEHFDRIEPGRDLCPGGCAGVPPEREAPFVVSEKAKD